MNEKEHKQRHVELHKALDELLADFISHTTFLPSKTTIFELMRWSHQQTIKPTKEQRSSHGRAMSTEKAQF